MKFKIDKFVISIIGTIILAYFFPFFGNNNNVDLLNKVGSIGVALIFFFYGLKLHPNKIKEGLKNWKLHILVQFSTFILFPLLVILFFPFVPNDWKTIWLAFLFLAALPSSVSSSVVMVSIARGNIPAAIFNASISGLIGIIVTPLWVGLFLHTTNSDFDLTEIYMKLIFEIFLPVVTGVFLQRFFGKFAERYSSYITFFDKAVVLLIIFKSFSESFVEHVFSTLGFKDMVMMFLGVMLLFFIMLFLTGFLSNKFRFNKEDRITAQFCGTKKSLIHGTVFSKVLFSSSIASGLILLPIMLFHSFQIFVISIIATNISNKED